MSQTVQGKEPDAQVVIPPHKTAVYSLSGDTQRGGHIQTIAQKGRIAWQRFTGYNIRNDVEPGEQLRCNGTSAFLATT